MKELNKRVAALETTATGKSGVVTVCIYDHETRDEAFARHLAAGGADPASAELVVIINKP